MKVAVVYNRESANVINLFGLPNREMIGRKTINRLVDALKVCGHQVIALEGDKDLIDRLEEFMPRVVQGERPGLVFNVSYGIQGQARYTHVPSILEMVGIPYVASGPLAHSLALDKVVTKMILRQHGLPTPDFAVLQSPDAPIPELSYPVIVKPKNEAMSFGLKVVQNEDELRAAAKVVFDEYRQAVLAEQYIEGKEINVGILGNDPPEAFPPVQLDFGTEGPAIYTYEDKTGRSGRKISPICPAPVSEEVRQHAQKIAKEAFTALGCSDCARVDMRLDGKGDLYILEVNSLPSLGEHGSYLVGAAQVGLDFIAFIGRLIEVASARYFGTPQPPQITGRLADPATAAFRYVVERRDRMERDLKEWTALHSRTHDQVGLMQARKRVEETLRELALRPVEELCGEHTVLTWETAKGFKDGMLFIVNLDVPIDVDFPAQPYRRDPEWLHGEGVGSSRGSLLTLEYALRALRSMRRLRHLPLGVLYYADEGYDARYSTPTIREAAGRAKEVFVLRPGNVGDHVVTQRRGQSRFRFRVAGESILLGRYSRKADTLRWTWGKLEEIAQLTNQNQRISVSTVDLRTERMPMRLPHRVTATIVITYPNAKAATTIEKKIRSVLGKATSPKWELEPLTDRPPFVKRPAGVDLFEELREVAQKWEIPLHAESSVWPSVAGLLAEDQPVLCGLGPVARDLRTPHESLLRISLVQRTLLLTQFLVARTAK
ncbi:MAG: ATP-grasp domain-containing protein [bacterium]